jgi:hypothetical protein
LALIYFLVPIGGLHRFYVGKTVSGVVYLLTFGLAAVGQIVDLVLILTGNFRDVEGRAVLAWENPPQPRPTPVNQLSAVPATESTTGRSRWRSRGLAALGIVFLIVSVLAVTLSLVSILVALGALDHAQLRIAEVGVNSQSLAEWFGTSHWPSIVQTMSWMVASSLAVVGFTLLLLARRFDGAWHMLRAIVAAVGFILAFSMISGGVSGVDWTAVQDAMLRENAGSAMIRVLAPGRFTTLLGSAAMVLLVSLFVLVWPSRHRDFPRSAQSGGR